jgi:hypothetical protein
MSYGTAGDAVRMFLSLGINCADLNALAQTELGDRPLVPSLRRGRSKHRGDRRVIARIFKREDDRLGE